MDEENGKGKIAAALEASGFIEENGTSKDVRIRKPDAHDESSVSSQCRSPRRAFS